MSEVLHRIRVNLYENFLTENPDDYSAKVISERTLNVKEICKTAVSRGGATSTAEAEEHNVALFLKEMAYQLMDGYSVNTGYFVANAQVRGVFDSRNETFDPAKHSVLFRFNQGDLLRKEIPNVKVQVMGVGETGIIISHVVDVKTGSVSPLKNLERFEWFVEKSVEISIDEITPLICHRTEKQSVKAERIEKIILSATKQSLKAIGTVLNPPHNFNEFISESANGIKMIAHCNESFNNRISISQAYKKGNDAVILIGPEGDFTTSEIEAAIQHNFTPVHLGKSRLRTETAGISACHSVYFMNM